MEEIINALTEIAKVHLGRDIVFNPEATLDGDLKLDSLDQIDMQLEIEKKFKIKIPENKYTIVTVGDLCDVILKLKK